MATRMMRGAEVGNERAPRIVPGEPRAGARGSDEGSVMGLERGGCVVQLVAVSLTSHNPRVGFSENKRSAFARRF
jgi:hypothetical protein